MRSPDIKSVASMSQLPWNSGGNHETLIRGPEAGGAREDRIINDVGYHFFQTPDLKLLAGRLLDREHGDEFIAFDRLVGPNTASNAYDLDPRRAGFPLIRISREHVSEAMNYIDSTWEGLAPKVQFGASSRMRCSTTLISPSRP